MYELDFTGLMRITQVLRHMLFRFSVAQYLKEFNNCTFSLRFL